jgi:hypothetical protein
LTTEAGFEEALTGLAFLTGVSAFLAELFLAGETLCLFGVGRFGEDFLETYFLDDGEALFLTDGDLTGEAIFSALCDGWLWSLLFSSRDCSCS